MRVIDSEPKHDSQGGAFYTFAIDARHGYTQDVEKSWRKDTITGCVYVDEGTVFVKRGDAFQPAAVLLGKKATTVDAHVCSADGATIAAK